MRTQSIRLEVPNSTPEQVGCSVDGQDGMGQRLEEVQVPLSTGSFSLLHSFFFFFLRSMVSRNQIPLRFRG